MNLIDLCICGTEAFHAAHWDAPLGTRLIAFSCSEACATTIEALRVDGRLTERAVNNVRKTHV